MFVARTFRSTCRSAARPVRGGAPAGAGAAFSRFVPALTNSVTTFSTATALFAAAMSLPRRRAEVGDRATSAGDGGTARIRRAHRFTRRR